MVMTIYGHIKVLTPVEKTLGLGLSIATLCPLTVVWLKVSRLLHSGPLMNVFSLLVLRLPVYSYTLVCS